MPFHFIFLQFCGNLQGCFGVTMKKKVLGNDEFLLKFDETKGRGSFKSLESLME